MTTTTYYQGVELPSEESLMFIPRGACKTCGYAHCKCIRNASFVLAPFTIGTMNPILTYNVYQEMVVIEEVEEEVPSRVIKTKNLWASEKSFDEVFMGEVTRWARNKPGDWEEVLGNAMVKYVELKNEYPVSTFDSEEKAKAYYMKAIVNNRIDLDRKENSFGKRGVVHVSLNTSDDDNAIGYYDTYDFEYDMEFSEAEAKTVAELTEWENNNGTNLRQENLNLYKKVAKLAKKVPEVENKKVVFLNSGKAIDLRSDNTTQKILSSEVVTIPLGLRKLKSYVDPQTPQKGADNA